MKKYPPLKYNLIMNMTPQEIHKYETIKEGRSALVVKSNILLHDARYRLSATEQKLIIYMVSKIAAEDKEFKHIKITNQEYCELANITRSGKCDEQIKNSIKTLSDKSWWLSNDNQETLFRWIDTANIANDGTIEIVLSESLKPYLIDLKKSFTKYELVNVLILRSKHSIRLYELFKSKMWLSTWKVSIDDLRSILNLEDKYKEYKDLNKRVIKTSIEEINKYTDITVSYKPLRTGKYNTHIIFDIEEKRGYQLCWDTILSQQERLGVK